MGQVPDCHKVEKCSQSNEQVPDHVHRWIPLVQEEEDNADAFDSIVGSPHTSQFLVLGDQGEAAEEFLPPEAASPKPTTGAGSASKVPQDQSTAKLTNLKEKRLGESGENFEVAEAGDSNASPAVPSTPRRPTASPPSQPPRRTYVRPQAVESAQIQPGYGKSPASLTPLLTEGAAEVEVEGEQDEAAEDLKEHEGEPPEDDKKESWRNRRIARGVPRLADAPKPTLQNIANTEADVAKMLKERGRLTDAPEEASEKNYLGRVGEKKAEWIYCGTDGNLMAARRKAMKGLTNVNTDRVVVSWTATGRLRTGLKQPPQKALPSSYLPQPPEHMRQRPPVTRSEVTEQRLIQATAAGYDHAQEKAWLDQDIALESQEFYEAELQAQSRLAVEAKLRKQQDRSMFSASSSRASSSLSGLSIRDSRVSFDMPRSAR